MRKCRNLWDLHLNKDEVNKTKPYICKSENCSAEYFDIYQNQNQKRN